MAKPVVFVDGASGTTGLRIRERLGARDDLELFALPDDRRKDPAARRDALHSCDAAILCLPDDAAREAAALAGDSRAVLIDTSTAHRTAPGWTYGFAELEGGARRDAVRASRRIANPGCHASGFVALVEPLVRSGLLRLDALGGGGALSCFSLTGYTGGGKKMIAQYEASRDERDPLLAAPRLYGLSQAHKHLPEMVAQCSLSAPPAFCPVVADFPCGMEVLVPLPASALRGGADAVAAVYRETYGDGPVVRFAGGAGESEGGFLSAAAMAGCDSMEISLHGGESGRLVAVARFDNLGKGASGAAIQNLNLALGFPETAGLVLR